MNLVTVNNWARGGGGGGGGGEGGEWTGTYSALTIPLASCSPLRRVPRTASISSMNMIAGCSLRASENTARTSLFESPYHFSVHVEI